jgi:hypothetical protein
MAAMRPRRPGRLRRAARRFMRRRDVDTHREKVVAKRRFGERFRRG